MSEDALRIQMLRKLVDEAGGPLAFAKKYSRLDADKPIDETYISQILNGHRNFGERAARNMERRAGLRYRYFEWREDATPAEIALAFETGSPGKREALTLLARLPDPEAEAILPLIRSILSKYE